MAGLGMGINERAGRPCDDGADSMLNENDPFFNAHLHPELNTLSAASQQLSRILRSRSPASPGALAPRASG